MTLTQSTLELTTRGRGTQEITRDIAAIVRESGIRRGLCHVFVHHTSASLIISENADPTVRADLERFLVHLVPDGEPLFEHQDEGPDDMPAHVRTLLTDVDLSIPVQDARLALGTWQGIYLYEHRHRGHRRRLTVSVQGIGEI